MQRRKMDNLYSRNILVLQVLMKNIGFQMPTEHIYIPCMRKYDATWYLKQDLSYINIKKVHFVES